MKATKRLLMVALVAVMVFSMTAFSSVQVLASSNLDVAVFQPLNEVPVELEDFDSEEYVEAMREFIAVFGEFTSVLLDLVDDFEFIETLEEMVMWLVDFETLLDGIASTAEYMASVTTYLPDEYLEAHMAILETIILVYESMTVLDVALTLLATGEYDEFVVGMELFFEGMFVAETIWSEAIGFYGEQSKELVGTWGWDELTDWTYVFNQDGTGTRGIQDAIEYFHWATFQDGILWLNFGAEMLYEAAHIQFWFYDIVGNVLTLDNAFVDEAVFSYIRQ